MSTTRRLLLMGLMAVCAFGADFSGKWKLDAAKSDFGPIPPPESMTRVVSQTKAAITFETTQKNAQGEVVTKYVFPLDGSEATSKSDLGEVKGTAVREGEAIRIKTKREANGMEITFDELWTLAADGKTLNVANKVGTPQGEFDLKLVLVKQ
ncbi:MAG: hypothetical protein ABI823_21515 [Bryobacteraceae bacterium]